MRAKRACYAGTARKTSRCNLAIEMISFVPSSQSTFNFSVLRGTQVDFLLVYKIPYRRAPRLAYRPSAFRPSASREQRYLAYKFFAV